MGKWKPLATRWYETQVRNCQLCGQMIPSRIWVAEVEGVTQEFCSPDCEDLYRDYWLPKYGGKAREGA